MLLRPLPLLCCLSLGLGALASSTGAFALDDGHGGASEGVRVETLARGNRSWDGNLLPPYPGGQPEVTVLRITIPAGVALARHHHPVINAGMLIQGQLEVVSDKGETRTLRAGDGLIEMVNRIHHGRSVGPGPAVIVVVYAGAVGMPITVRESPTNSGL